MIKNHHGQRFLLRNMLKAVTYSRVSSSEQRDSGYSISAQNDLFKNYADQKGLDIVKTYEESYSAKGQGRKLFDEMIKFVKKNKIKVILFEKVDRMTRNFHDLIAIYDLVEKYEVDVHLIKNALVLNKESRSQDKFQLDIQVVLARNYVNNLSEEVKKGMTQKLAEGGWNHIAPFGYRNIRVNGRAIVEPDPETMPILKQIFDLALQGESIKRISKYITDITGTKFHHSKIGYLLKNTFYIGEINSKHGVYKGRHETFITPINFYAVQEALDTRKKQKTPTARSFRFSGILKCSCGSAMYGELKKGKYVTYGCSSKLHGKECGNTPRYISERVIMEKIDGILSQVNIDNEFYEVIKNETRKVYDQISEDTDRLSDNLNKEIKQTKNKIMKLLDHYEDELLTKEEYLERKDTLNKQLVKLQSKHEIVNQTPIGYRTTFMDMVKTYVFVRKLVPEIENVHDFQRVITLILSNLVHDHGNLDFELNLIGKMIIDLKSTDLVGPIGQDLAPGIISHYYNIYCEQLNAA